MPHSIDLNYTDFIFTTVASYIPCCIWCKILKWSLTHQYPASATYRHTPHLPVPAHRLLDTPNRPNKQIQPSESKYTSTSSSKHRGTTETKHLLILMATEQRRPELRGYCPRRCKQGLSARAFAGTLPPPRHPPPRLSKGCARAVGLSHHPWSVGGRDRKSVV